MNRVGFKPSTIYRTPIRNDQGAKIGYLSHENGKQVFRSPEGRLVLLNVRLKGSPSSRTSACGGTILPEAWWSSL